MDYQVVNKLPQHLVSAYQAGKVFISNGVVRYVDTGTIVAHLEQASPVFSGMVGNANPQMAMLNAAFQAARAAKGVADTAMISRALNLTQQLKMLSVVNTAISGASLGVTLIGFGVVLHQLNRFNERVKSIESQLDIIKFYQSELFKDRVRDVIEDVRYHIKHCITLIHTLQDFGWSENLDQAIAQHLDKTESTLYKVLGKYLDQERINVPLELAQQLYSTYVDLIKVSMTSRFLSERSLDRLSLRLQTLDEFAGKLTSVAISDELREEYLTQREHKLSVQEIEYIIDLYICGCNFVRESAYNHREILQTTQLKQFNRWQKLLKSSEESWIWIDHSAGMGLV